MDMTFLTEFCVPVIAGICLCVGYVVKKWLKDVDNKFIPTINAVLGVVLALWMSGFVFEPQTILQGLFSGLSATGLYEAFRQFIEKGDA